MHLIFFDLDGTLLNGASEISLFTKDTLSLLREKNILYTVATGRTMLSAESIMEGHGFDLPQIYSNGVTVWNPKTNQLSLENLLDNTEISTVINIALFHGVTPFVHTIGTNHQHFIFHTSTKHDVEKNLVHRYFANSKAKLLSLKDLPIDSQVTHISMIGDNDVIYKMSQELNELENLIAYSGPAMEGKNFSWMDVHHRQANKGSAVTNLRSQLGVNNVICFGDSDNDLSMFASADESYAPENAKESIKNSASAVIGSNHKDGVAHFLRERFSL